MSPRAQLMQDLKKAIGSGTIRVWLKFNRSEMARPVVAIEINKDVQDVLKRIVSEEQTSIEERCTVADLGTVTFTRYLMRNGVMTPDNVKYLRVLVSKGLIDSRTLEMEVDSVFNIESFIMRLGDAYKHVVRFVYTYLNLDYTMRFSLEEAQQ